MPDIREITTGLRFPEGPVAMPDGSVILVEMLGKRLTRVQPDGSKETIAEIAGGPTARRSAGRARVPLQQRRCFTPLELGEWLLPVRSIRVSTSAADPTVDLSSGTVTDLYTECDGRPLRAPNDLVFDADGGFWFTDHGIRDERGTTSDLTSIYYAKADGSHISEQVHPSEAPNGIGLSPDGSKLYWRRRSTVRVPANHRLARVNSCRRSRSTRRCAWPVCPAYQLLDSLGVDGDGNICVATLVNGGSR
jgi:gluconolactonase